MLNVIEKTIDLGDGRQITIQTGKLAKQADGSVVVKMGGTMLLATVVSAKEVKPDTDFMPLSVEYKEKFYSVGRFPGGFMKRESKAGDYEILIARLVDRALRPLFPDDYHAETFVTINLISAEKDIAPDALAGLAASSALMVSDIPFNGPVSEVRVARVDGKFIVNPSFSELAKADIEIMVGATYDNISMVEGEMNEVSEDDMAEALKFAHNYIKEQCKVQMELAKAVNKQKREYEPEPQDEELTKALHDYSYDKIYQIGKSALPKHQRDDGFTKIKEDFIESKKTEWEGNLTEEEINVKINIIKRDYEKLIREAIRNMILNEGIRIDGRKTNEIRPIWCEVDCLPAAHGSAIFTRGETQALASVTLGTKLDEKIIDEVLMQGREKFVLHYNFPPFATGEAKSARGLSRREIGHGNLAHRALKRMIPPDNENPYAIRVVSEILESNGSSSMATVCAGTMALMDAGVKIKRPVSGIAMGLITDASGKFAVLSDILGDEDHFGDMDFKVCGTIEGITACQMDIKIDGLSYDILGKALAQAKEGRHFILGKLLETIPEPRADYKPHAPRIVQITIPKETIGALIGPGGKIIQEIQSDTKTTITIEEVDSKGFVSVFGENKEALDAAMRRINAIVEVPEVGKIYKGKVKSLMPFGAFIEILPGKDGLLHISEIEWRRIEKVEDVLKEGQEVEVKLIDVDKKTGKLKLSRKVLLPRPAKADVKE